MSGSPAGGAVSGRPRRPQRKGPTGGWGERGRRGLITATGPAGRATHPTGYFRIGVKNSPKVVSLGLKLPPVNGLKVLRRIKSDKRTRAIPVVDLTSSEDRRDIVESYQLGANSYIVKPVDFDEFMRAVSELVTYWLFLDQSPRQMRDMVASSPQLDIRVPDKGSAIASVRSF